MGCAQSIRVHPLAYAEAHERWCDTCGTVPVVAPQLIAWRVACEAGGRPIVIGRTTHGTLYTACRGEPRSEDAHAVRHATAVVSAAAAAASAHTDARRCVLPTVTLLNDINAGLTPDRAARNLLACDVHEHAAGTILARVHSLLTRATAPASQGGLFIYGDHGLGKTGLLRACARLLPYWAAGVAASCARTPHAAAHVAACTSGAFTPTALIARAARGEWGTRVPTPTPSHVTRSTLGSADDDLALVTLYVTASTLACGRVSLSHLMLHALGVCDAPPPQQDLNRVARTLDACGSRMVVFVDDVHTLYLAPTTDLPAARALAELHAASGAAYGDVLLVITCATAPPHVPHAWEEGEPVTAAAAAAARTAGAPPLARRVYTVPPTWERHAMMHTDMKSQLDFVSAVGARGVGATRVLACWLGDDADAIHTALRMLDDTVTLREWVSLRRHARADRVRETCNARWGGGQHTTRRTWGGASSASRAPPAMHQALQDLVYVLTYALVLRNTSLLASLTNASHEPCVEAVAHHAWEATFQPLPLPLVRVMWARARPAQHFMCENVQSRASTPLTVWDVLEDCDAFMFRGDGVYPRRLADVLTMYRTVTTHAPPPHAVHADEEAYACLWNALSFQSLQPVDSSRATSVDV